MGVPLPITVSRGETPDGSWAMALRDAPAALGGGLSRYCGYEERMRSTLRRREVPNGRIVLILSFGAKIEVAEMSRSPQPAPGPVSSFVAGLHDGYVMIDSGHQHGIQLDLTPLAAYRLLGVPMRVLANQVVELDDLRGGSVVELTDRLAGQPTWEQRFALLDETLLRWADEGPAPDPAVRWAWQQMVRSDGRVGVGTLSDEIGWSRRHFAKRFRDQVGLPPKTTAQVLRFSRAASLLLEQQPGGTITDVATACGYADHSHLDREFQQMAGCTPSAWLAAQVPGIIGAVQ